MAWPLFKVGTIPDNFLHFSFHARKQEKSTISCDKNKKNARKFENDISGIWNLQDAYYNIYMIHECIFHFIYYHISIIILTKLSYRNIFHFENILSQNKDHQ